MSIKIESLHKNNTWDIVDLPYGKEVFTIKYHVDGSIERYKARLVAKGYNQVYGINYTMTFSPFAKMTLVRIILSLTMSYDWPLYQFDVKNAFLNGDLTEDVYMSFPLGIYGKEMLDDIVVTSSDIEEVTALKKFLNSEFEIKDLGELRYFLGIEVARSKGSSSCMLPKTHMVAAELRKGILFVKHGHMKVEAYIDVDWTGNVDDRISTSGYCAMVARNFISWRSKKQSWLLYLQLR
ncbi:PREDICTED: uncharacterized protein LOC104590619 [Nelumbo nucifera]|uniref:Uncharacterized protein LOC104590619 n=1 Tax=Nelumbo nucifera TaxID=4432 RepID=A0A1U7Z997_NELNU|nr:PREDICTED: uncharacterized protein LOC104590619 [Nelumbo nucifera]